MKIAFLLLLLLSVPVLALAEPLRIATFDSGFGGFFTAKAIEKAGDELQRTHELSLSITHYGDTLNAPYGEKTPVEIAQFSSRGISRAFDDGADYVFIACNTASTRFQDIRAILNAKNPGRGDRIISIIDSSVMELRKKIDKTLVMGNRASVAILATPATVKSGAYLRALAEAYGANLTAGEIKKHPRKRWHQKKGDMIDNVSQDAVLRLASGKEIYIHQIGPANWVDLIEHGADAQTKSLYVQEDLRLLAGGKKFSVVGEFCTHFPAVDQLIKNAGKRLGIVNETTSYIQQGALMAKVFRELVETKSPLRKQMVDTEAPRARIFISGGDLSETRDLAREIFPGDPQPFIEKKNF